MRIVGKVALAALVGAAISVSAQAEGDVALGEKVFRKCKACHSFDPAKKKMGPTLAGVMGRKAAAVEGYKYSKGFQKLDVVWDDASMAAFLKAPRKFAKGTKMAFAGLRKPADVENLLAYMKANAE